VSLSGNPDYIPKSVHFHGVIPAKAGIHAFLD